MGEYRKVQGDKRKIERMSRSRGKKVKGDGQQPSDTIYWSDFRYVPKEGFLGKHRKTFLNIHGDQVKLFLNENKQYKQIFYDTLLNNYYANKGRQYVLDSTHGNDVLGWYPAYDTSKVISIDTKLLSILSYNFLQFMPHSGEPFQDAAYLNWRKPGFVDSLKTRNPKMKVLLNVHMHVSDELHTFLSHDFPQGNLIRIVGELMDIKGADGIEISFKNPQQRDSIALNKFIIKLADRVRGESGKKMVILSLDPFYEETPYNIPLLQSHIDRFVIKGFDFQDVWNSTPGPFAPLNTLENRHNINKSLFKYFINNKISPKNVILGLPLQAPIWETATASIMSNNVGDFQLMNFLEYWEVKSEFEAMFEKPGFDYISGSAYYLEDKGDTLNLMWFENKTSLDVKFKWAKENGLAGVGLWDISNTGNFQEVWTVVAENFGQDSLVNIRPIDFQNDKLYGFMAQLSTHRKNIAAGVVILLSFIFAAVLFCFYDWRIREIFFKNYDYRLIIGVVVLVLTLIPLFLFVISPSHVRIDATQQEFEALVKQNNMQIQKIQFKHELAVTHRDILMEIGVMKKLDSLNAMYEDGNIAQRKEYRRLSNLNKQYSKLTDLIRTDDVFIDDKIMNKSIEAAQKKIKDRLIRLAGSREPLNVEESRLAEKVEVYEDLRSVGEKLKKMDEKLLTGIPDTITKIDMLTVEVTMAEGDSRSEDFMEILCSALAGAFVMYLVSLIYYKRRQKLP